MWKLSIEDDQANQTVVDLVREDYSVGRDVANTVRLTERNIPRKHATIRRNGVGWTVKDLGSANGCFINGARVAGEAPMKHGDLVQLGDYRLELIDESLAQKDPESKTATLPGRPQPNDPRSYQTVSSSSPDRMWERVFRSWTSDW